MHELHSPLIVEQVRMRELETVNDSIAEVEAGWVAARIVFIP